MKEKISSLTSSTISALRFPLTVGVVFIHFNVLSDNLAVRGTGNAEHFPTWLVCMFNLFSEVLPRIAVPLFFIISGYLFFRSGFMIRTYTDKLRRRVRTLLVPYILWNLLYLIRTAFSGHSRILWLKPRHSASQLVVVCGVGVFLGQKSRCVPCTCIVIHLSAGFSLVVCSRPYGHGRIGSCILLDAQKGWMVGSCGFGYGLACLAFHLQYNLLGTVLHSGFLLLVGSLLRSERYGLGGLDCATARG